LPTTARQTPAATAVRSRAMPLRYVVGLAACGQITPALINGERQKLADSDSRALCVVMKWNPRAWCFTPLAHRPYSAQRSQSASAHSPRASLPRRSNLPSPQGKARAGDFRAGESSPGPGVEQQLGISRGPQPGLWLAGQRCPPPPSRHPGPHARHAGVTERAWSG